MKKNMKSTIVFLVATYILAMLIILFLNPPQIEGHRGGIINTMHVNEGPIRIGGDIRFAPSGVNISSTVYNQNSYCFNNPQSTICRPK